MIDNHSNHGKSFEQIQPEIIFGFRNFCHKCILDYLRPNCISKKINEFNCRCLVNLYKYVEDNQTYFYVKKDKIVDILDYLRLNCLPKIKSY